MRRRLFLIIWTLGILFPLPWIVRYFPGFRSHFGAVFSREWAHVVMHLILYAGFAILIIHVFNLKPVPKVLGWVLLITLGVGVVQEIIQQIASNIPYLRWNSLFDLGVNLVGSLLGFGAAAGYRNLRAPY